MFYNDPRPRIWRSILLLAIVVVLYLGFYKVAQMREAEHTPQTVEQLSSSSQKVVEKDLPIWAKVCALGIIIVPLARTVWKRRYPPPLIKRD